MKKTYTQAEPYVTKDGSLIRELIHPNQGISTLVSLAEATVAPGMKTISHIHLISQEIYHVTQGRGLMTLGAETFEVGEGDSVLIRPGTAHCMENTRDRDLKILCCCCPPYSHEDTEMS